MRNKGRRRAAGDTHSHRIRTISCPDRALCVSRPWGPNQNSGGSNRPSRRPSTSSTSGTSATSTSPSCATATRTPAPPPAISARPIPASTNGSSTSPTPTSTSRPWFRGEGRRDKGTEGQRPLGGCPFSEWDSASPAATRLRCRRRLHAPRVPHSEIRIPHSPHRAFNSYSRSSMSRKKPTIPGVFSRVCARFDQNRSKSRAFCLTHFNIRAPNRPWSARIDDSGSENAPFRGVRETAFS